MAKVRETHKSNAPMVLESPNPNSSRIFIEYEGHDKSTLAPVFGSHVYPSRGRTPVSGAAQNLGSNYYRPTSSDGYAVRSGDGSTTMSLTKETAYSPQTTYSTGNNVHSNVGYMHLLSLDPEITSSPVRRLTDGSRTLDIWLNRQYHWSTVRMSSWLNSTSDWDEQQADFEFTVNRPNSGVMNWLVWPAAWESGTDYVSFIAEYSNQVSSVNNLPYCQVARLKYDDMSTSTVSYSTARQYYTIQFVGKSEISGKAIYLYNSRLNDYSQYITMHNALSNNTTDLNTFLSVPLIDSDGSSAGGERATTTIGSIVKFGSKWFDDPTASGTVGFYLPYFDENFNYHPFWIQWDKTADTFTRNDDVVISGDQSTTHLSNISGSPGASSGFATICVNETFENAGNRYLSLFTVTGLHQAHDASPESRTFLSYSVNPTNPKALTYHSKITIPETPKNVVFLNDSKTLLGVIGATAFYVYAWDNVNGWTLTSTIAEAFTSVGRDSTDRIWATSVNSADEYGDLHILSSSIPIRITIAAASSTYNYTGSNINSTINVSAYNIDGERLATNVDLTIEGNTMTFSGGALTTTVTTSASGETSVPIIITAAGFSEILTSVSL